MIERLIEHWLTSSDERGYEIAFCQLLMSDGHRILHKSGHSQTEHGADIISIDNIGQLHAYQLKAGNIGARRWRSDVQPELVPLLETMVEYPGMKPAFAVSHLVTTGRVTGPALDEMRKWGDAERARGFHSLDLVVGTALVQRFLKCHGRFLPSEPQDFEAFLRLHLSDGRDLLCKSGLARFAASTLDPALLKSSETARAVGSALLLTSYALAPYSRARNHFACFEGWILLCAHIAALAEEQGARDDLWKPSFELALDAALHSLQELANEALSADRLVAGNVMMDGGAPYRARVTMLVGAVCAHVLVARFRGRDSPHDRELRTFITKNRPHLFLWGESAVPFFAAIAIYLEQACDSALAEALIASLIKTICRENSPYSRRGLPSPYYGPERCVAEAIGVQIGDAFEEDFCGYSYSLQPLIDFMVRRGRKQMLRLLWKPVTRIQLAEFAVKHPHRLYRWRTQEGTVHLRFARSPERWSRLVSEVDNIQIDELPITLRERPEFAFLFLLVYPHRFSRALLRFVEHITD